MLARLIKFVIVTRFSKPLLGVVALFLAYNIVTGIFAGGGRTRFSGGFSYYAVGGSMFFMVLSLFLGGLFVLKSDRDYLLTLPLSRRDLSLSLFMAQYLGSGISILFFFGFYIAGAADSLETTILLAANLALLGLLVTALGVISNILVTWKRVLVGLALAVWCLSSFLGFQFTPVAAFTGSVLYGSIVLSGVTLIAVPVALRELGHLELGSMRTLMRATSSEYKRNVTFSGKSPVRAIYSYHLSFMELVGRVNLAGATSFRAARVKTSTVVLISAILAGPYLFLTGPSPINSSPSRPAIFVVPLVMGIVILVLMLQGVFADERGWLAFTAMDPAKYLRHLILSKVLSSLGIVGPYAVADLILFLLGVAAALNSLIVLLVTIPSASVISIYLLARVGDVQQVREEGMMPGQFSLRQMLVILPVYGLVGLIVASGGSLTAALIIAPVLAVLAFLLMLRASVWRGIASRLIERGFV